MISTEFLILSILFLLTALTTGLLFLRLIRLERRTKKGIGKIVDLMRRTSGGRNG